MIVELSKICKSYSRGKEPVPVLFDIDMSVPRGDYIAIMGPSGSGKTTLMNIIGYLDVPSSGSYKLAGRDYTSGSDDELAEVRNRNIGFVFQNFYLLPKLDALDNVALPLLYADVPLKERRERAKAALERVGLGDRIHFMPNQLSGGQCQRVAIARAIVGNPELLLADEPTGALDSASGRQVMEIFRDLNKAGVSVIIITHEQSVADCANRIYRIFDGRIVSVEEGNGGLLAETEQLAEYSNDIQPITAADEPLSLPSSKADGTEALPAVESDRTEALPAAAFDEPAALPLPQVTENVSGESFTEQPADAEAEGGFAE